MPVKNTISLTHSLVLCLGIDYGGLQAAVVATETTQPTQADMPSTESLLNPGL